MMKKYLLVLMICAIANTASLAQWNLNFQGVPGYYRIFAVEFLNNSVGFVGGGTQLVNGTGRISKTTNGGLTWTTVLSTTATTDITDIQFINANLGFAVGTSGFIAKTTDGGNTWTTQNFTDNQGLQEVLRSVYFVDQNIGYAAGAFNVQWAIKTTDGGNTWASMPLPNPVQRINSIFFTNANTGYIVGGDPFSGGYGRLFYTNNGGTSWDTINTGVNNSFFDAVYFTNTNTGFIGGSNGLILKTTNGGQTWAPQNNLDPDPSAVRQFSFINSNLGFACTLGGAILKTTNGGATWTRDFYISNALSFYAISVPSTTFGIVAGLGNTYVKMSGITGTEDLTEKNTSFSIYPNPSNGNFTIRPAGHNRTDGNIRIIDVQGKEVFSSKLETNNEWDLELRGLSNGLYIVFIENGEHSITKKLVINK